MADFRRWILALAMLVLVLGCVAPASAQQSSTFACNANAAVPPTLRQEGITELAGDIILTCTGGTPTPVDVPVPQANVSVYLSLPLSSRVLSGNVTEALLLIDEPSGDLDQQNVCPSPNNGLPCQATGTNGASYATNGNYNVFQGITIGPNAVTFLGIPVDPPTSPTSPARIYRITNIRVNASAAGASVGLPTPVNTLISISSSTSVGLSNPSPVIGIVQKGLTFTPSPLNPTLLQCQNYELTEVGSITFTENFASAFKTRTTPDQTTPGAIYNTESGLEVAGGGLADFGTRLMATITNIPSGASIAVDNWALSPASVDCGDGGPCFYATLVGTDPTVADPAFDVGDNWGEPLPEGGITDVTDGIDSTGTLTVVWEVVGANPSAIDQFTFGVYVSFTGAPGNPGSPTPNVTAQVVGSFAPLSSSGPLATGGWVDQIPTFVTTSVSSPPANLFNVSLCQTILLFPYITDYPGFDTGIAISNTSADPLPVGAAPQTGSCSVNFYGGAYDTTGFTNNATNLGSSGVYSSTLANFDGTGLVGPGQTWTFGVSAIDAMLGQAGYLGTTGYAIAICDFQYAHGYSFVSDYGLRNFAAAYLALVIPDAPRSPEPFLCSAGAFGCINQTGEQLVH